MSPLRYEPRHFEQAKQMLADDRAKDRATGRETLAEHYDSDFDWHAAKQLAHMLATRERQQAYRAEQKVRFTERAPCGFYRDAA